MKAQFKGKYQGKRYHAFQVVCKQSGIYHSTVIYRETVIAHNPSAACSLVASSQALAAVLLQRPYPVEIETVGPQGGQYSTFVGWESVIWRLMQAHRLGVQRRLLV